MAAGAATIVGSGRDTADGFLQASRRAPSHPRQIAHLVRAHRQSDCRSFSVLGMALGSFTEIVPLVVEIQ
jgi:hypothetical protein